MFIKYSKFSKKPFFIEIEIFIAINSTKPDLIYSNGIYR